MAFPLSAGMKVESNRIPMNSSFLRDNRSRITTYIGDLFIYVAVVIVVFILCPKIFGAYAFESFFDNVVKFESNLLSFFHITISKRYGGFVIVALGFIVYMLTISRVAFKRRKCRRFRRRVRASLNRYLILEDLNFDQMCLQLADKAKTNVVSLSRAPNVGALHTDFNFEFDGRLLSLNGSYIDFQDVSWNMAIISSFHDKCAFVCAAAFKTMYGLGVNLNWVDSTYSNVPANISIQNWNDTKCVATYDAANASYIPPRVI